MTWLILGVALLVGSVLVMRWFVTANPKTIIRFLKWTGLALAILLGLFILLTGRFAWLWAVFIGLLPWVGRMRMLGRFAKAARGPTRGRHSDVKTRFVTMRLYHDSGDMDGDILEGAHAGRRLSDLTQNEVASVWREAQALDAQSAKVLEAYLDRVYGDAWDSGATDESKASSSSAGGAMSVDEAYKILGLDSSATKADIGQRHRDLMKKMHPDHGGSDYLASRINEAKETLLG